MTKTFEKLLSALLPDEQRELERFAAYLLLRRKISTEQSVADEISSDELMQLAMRGGSFDWLANEPDIYSIKDGEPVQWPKKS